MPLQAVKDAHYVLSDDTLRNKYNEMGYAALGPQYAKYSLLGKKHDQAQQAHKHHVMPCHHLEVCLLRQPEKHTPRQ